MLDPKTTVYRYPARVSRQDSVFHLDPQCRAVQGATKLTKGTLGGSLAAGRRMCKICGIDYALLPPAPVLPTLPLGAV